LNAIILSNRETRDEFLKATNEAGVMTRPIWRLLNKLEMYKDCRTDDLINAQWLEDRVVNIPSSVRKGTIVMHQALINAGARIGKNCIINTKALIEHDATIGEHCHIATGAIINGGVKVGSGTFFGSNAVCKEYIEIGKNTVIGCGTKIIKNIPPQIP